MAQLWPTVRSTGRSGNGRVMMMRPGVNASRIWGTRLFAVPTGGED